MALEIKLNNQKVDKEKDVENKKKKKGMRLRWKLFIITLVIAVFITGGIALGGWQLSNRFGINISSINPFTPEPELQKDSTGDYTNALIVGLDSRGKGSGLANTDTIILLSHNHNTRETVLLSIPRDFFVKVPEQNRYTKINAIYSIGERQKPGAGLDKLEDVVENITNKEIQYNAMVDLIAFTKLIDTIGGITVDVENSFTDYKYPVEESIHDMNETQGRYTTISFEAGEQIMDGSTALKFVRSRKSLDNQEGSDFARAARQQRVLIGLKDKLLSTEVLLNPRNVFEILNILEDHVKYSEISNRDIQAFTEILKDEGVSPHTFVLDPNIAQNKIITDRGIAQDAYAIGPIKGLGNYNALHEYLEYVMKYPAIYSQEPSISVYDVGLGTNQSIEKTKELQSTLPYINITFQNTLRNDKGGQYIFSNMKETKNNLKDNISKALDIENKGKPESLKNKEFFGEYIILLGKEEKDLEKTPEVRQEQK